MEKMKEKPIILDGAMGTELIKRGLKTEEIADAWNLTHWDQIVEIHRAYTEAGAQVISTNTFGCHLLRLADFGQEKNQNTLISKAFSAATLAGPGRALIAGVIGPIGSRNKGIHELADHEIGLSYRTVLKAFIEQGAGMIVLETQTHQRELAIATKTARELLASEQIPLMVSMTLNEAGRLPGDQSSPIDMINKFLNEQSDIIGFNCGTGPKDLLAPLQQCLPFIRKPISVKPNTGLTPNQLPPEQFASLMKPFKKLGIRYLGGCCGSTPEHIRALMKM